MTANRTLTQVRRRLMPALAIGGVALAGPVLAAELGMLDTLSRGMWEVRDRDSGAISKVCVRDGRELIQLRHRSLACSRLVIDDAPTRVTVQYTCRGQGYGHTEIRKGWSAASHSTSLRRRASPAAAELARGHGCA